MATVPKPGPPGPKGDQGDPGADGAPGTPGPSNLHVQAAPQPDMDPGALWVELNNDGTVKTVWVNT